MREKGGQSERKGLGSRVEEEGELRGDWAQEQGEVRGTRESGAEAGNWDYGMQAMFKGKEHL